MIDTGMASAGMIVARSVARNRKMMRMTSPAVISSVSRASAMERWTKIVPSNAMFSVTPAGNASRIAGSSRCTPAATSSTLAFDWRTTPMKTASLPEYRVTERSSSGPISTFATSRSLTSWFSRLETVSSLNSSAVFISPR